MCLNFQHNLLVFVDTNIENISNNNYKEVSHKFTLQFIEF